MMNGTICLALLLAHAILKAEAVPKKFWVQRQDIIADIVLSTNEPAPETELSTDSLVKSTDLPDPDPENSITPTPTPENATQTPRASVSASVSTSVTPTPSFSKVVRTTPSFSQVVRTTPSFSQVMSTTPSFSQVMSTTPSQTPKADDGRISGPTRTPPVLVSASPTPTPTKTVMQGIAVGQQSPSVSTTSPSAAPTPWLSEEIKGAITGSVIGGVFAIAATVLGVWRCRIVRRVRQPFDGEMEQFY